jgi:hypothetical protein
LTETNATTTTQPSQPSQSAQTSSSDKGNNSIGAVAAVDTVDTFGNSITQDPNFNKRIVQHLGNYVAFDLEWNESGVIEAVSFVDSLGNGEVKFRTRDFGGSELKLLGYIMAKLTKYKWSIGWYTQANSNDIGNIKPDLAVIHERCKVNGVKSKCIVKLGFKGVPYVINNSHHHIDLFNVYNNKIVHESIYHKAYRTLELDEVSKNCLAMVNM